MRNLKLTALPVLLLLLLCPARDVTAVTPPEIIARGKNATVLVRAGGAEGSAFCLDASGLFVTNQHVVGSAANTRVVIVLHSGERGQTVVPARVLRADAEMDLALLKLETPEPLVALPLGSSEGLFETMNVTAFGFPFGTDLALRDNEFPNVSVSSGHISALRVSHDALQEIQLDAALNPGNSGGPVVNERGEVIGIVASGIEWAESVNFAIPVSQLQQFLRAPNIAFDPAPIQGAQMSAPQEFIFTVSPLREQNAPAQYQVEFSLGIGTQARKISAQAIGGGQYRVRAIPVPNVSGPVAPAIVPYQIKVSQNGRVVGTAAGSLKIQNPPRVKAPNAPVVTKPEAPIKTNAPAKNNAPANVPTANKDDDDWLAGGKTTGADNATSIGESGRMLLQNPRTVVDATVTAVGINAGALVEDMLWSADGKTLYALESSGILHLISVPEFREEKVAKLGQKCRYFGMCQLGLVVALPEIQEVWLLDGASLQVLKRITVAGVTGMGASPALPLVYVAQGEQFSDKLSILDFASGKVVNQLNARAMQNDQGGNIKKHPNGVVLSEFKQPTVTPDGGYLFCEGFECLHRFRITGTELVYEEIGARIGSNAQDIEISPDSKYVAMPSGGGNGNISINGEPAKTGYTIFIYRAGDLSEPISVLASGAYPKALAFDRAGGKLYTQNHDFQLISFTPQGEQQKQYNLSGKKFGSEEVQQILPHPGGNKVLVLVNDGRGSFGNQAPQGTLYWVELPVAP